MKNQKSVNIELYAHQKCLSKMKARLLASTLDVEFWKRIHSNIYNKKKANNLKP